MAALLRHRGANDTITSGVALVVASVLFGVYHVAHCLPFNTAEMVGLLALVSEGTVLFYFVGRRDIVRLYLTIRLPALIGCYYARCAPCILSPIEGFNKALNFESGVLGRLLHPYSVKDRNQQTMVPNESATIYDRVTGRMADQP